MTGTYLKSQSAVNYAPPIIPIKKQILTINGCKVIINYSNRPDKTVIGELKRLIIDGHAKPS